MPRAFGTFLAWQSRDSAGCLPSSTLSRLSKPLLPLLLLDLPANTWAKGLKEGSRNMGEGSGRVDTLEGILYSDVGAGDTVRAALTAVGEVERQTEPVTESETGMAGEGGGLREDGGSEQAQGRQRATQTTKRRAAWSPAWQRDPHSVRVEGRDVLGVGGTDIGGGYRRWPPPHMRPGVSAGKELDALGPPDGETPGLHPARQRGQRRPPPQGHSQGEASEGQLRGKDRGSLTDRAADEELCAPVRGQFGVPYIAGLPAEGLQGLDYEATKTQAEDEEKARGDKETHSQLLCWGQAWCQPLLSSCVTPAPSLTIKTGNTDAGP